MKRLWLDFTEAPLENNKTMTIEETTKQSNVSKWRQRLQNEADHGPKIFIDEPLDTDVLLGKHRDAFNHVGNRSFRTLIQDHWERYNNAAGRCERTAIVVQIVDFLREKRQVRFLKRDNSVGKWYIVHDSVAREKVGHAIRDAINFRRHHLRKMAAEARREKLEKGSVCAKPSSTSTDLPQILLELPSGGAALEGQPDIVALLSETETFALKNQNKKMSKKKYELPFNPKSRDDSLSRDDIVGILGGMKQTDENKLPIVTSRNSPENHGYHSNCSSDPPSLHLSPSTETYSIQDEAAMLGAFNVWASQTFSEA